MAAREVENRKQGLPCPNCGDLRSNVTNSEMRGEGTWRMRRRQCYSCGQRYTTREVLLIGTGRTR